MLNWEKMPAEIRYISDSAEKYRHIVGDFEIIYFYNNISKHAINELSEISWKISDDYSKIDDWLNEFSITKNKESELVYNLIHLIAIGNDSEILKRKKIN